jgi:hypothetical protein
MNFDTAAYLRKSTGRAKSDVANKLVSMFLHDVSRKLSSKLILSVVSPKYSDDVLTTFGLNCCYCNCVLEHDRTAVEHLDGMNWFRAGLHIAGNVIVSCKKCNNEKRRDDQLRELKLAKTGWESFLCHDSTKCSVACKTCAYWKSIWPDENQRINNLELARNRILKFRAQHREAIELSQKIQPSLHRELEKIYRECQTFATDRIKGSVDQVIAGLPT